MFRYPQEPQDKDRKDRWLGEDTLGHEGRGPSAGRWLAWVALMAVNAENGQFARDMWAPADIWVGPFDSLIPTYLNNQSGGGSDRCCNVIKDHAKGLR